MPKSFNKIAIIGTGLIGGSVLKRVVELSAEISFFCVEPNLGIHSDLETFGVTAFSKISDLANSDIDLFIIASPLSCFPQTVQELSSVVGPESVVIDVGSVKGPLFAELEQIKPVWASRFVSTHPMAGSEFSGFSNSTPAMLVGAVWGLVPTKETNPLTFFEVLEWLIDNFEGRVLPLPQEDHDESVALISQLPHVLANVLLATVGRAKDNAAAFTLSAGSFRDGTRVAGTAAARTEAMVLDNSKSLLPLISQIVEELESLASYLENKNTGDLFTRASLAKHRQKQVKEAQPFEFFAPELNQKLMNTLLQNGIDGRAITGISGTLKTGFTITTTEPLIEI